MIVIGDSFSAENIWQSYAQNKSGRKFLTFNWNRLGSPRCLKDFVISAHNRYPSARYVIIQTIERHTVTRFERTYLDCDVSRVLPINTRISKTKTSRSMTIDEVMPDPIYALLTLNNSFKISQSEFNISGDTAIRRLTTNKLFSSKRSDILLYLENDHQKLTWSSSNFAQVTSNISDLQEEAKKNGLHLIMLVVPDKSTVYDAYKTTHFNSMYPNIWESLAEKNIVQVRLDKLMLQQVRSVVDLYKPNDTHLSTEGFKLMSEAVVSHLEK